MSLGKNLKALRTARGWDQKTLSQKSGVGVGTISAIEVRNSIRSQFAPALAAALGVSINQLLEGTQEAPASGKEGEESASVLEPIPANTDELASAIEKVETALEKIKAASSNNMVHIEHAWPFKGIRRDEWESLSEEQKTAIETVARTMLSTHKHSAGAGASHTEKRQATG